jgi:hypothetical protein
MIREFQEGEDNHSWIFEVKGGGDFKVKRRKGGIED